ncbi:hypothetical protein FPRO04_14797 [Fusarium proliferatum]|nr:hypothetical protein FPRO04_14797 [Fusarium proliferatum]
MLKEQRHLPMEEDGRAHGVGNGQPQAFVRHVKALQESLGHVRLAGAVCCKSQLYRVRNVIWVEREPDRRRERPHNALYLAEIFPRHAQHADATVPRPYTHVEHKECKDVVRRKSAAMAPERDVGPRSQAHVTGGDEILRRRLCAAHIVTSSHA